MNVTLQFVIVDDNSQFGETARDVLEGEGVSVVGVATSGKESAWLVRRLHPDVVLLDIELGEESGFDVARLLVSGGSSPPPRVILISTHDESDFRDLIEESPAIGFLSKADLSAAAIYRLLADDEDGEFNARRET